MRYVLALAREGTHSAAARALRVDHTTVGRRIAAAEEAMAVRLFTRTPSGWAPSAAGDRVLVHAREVESRVDALRREVTGRDAQLAGRVRISAIDFHLTHLIAPGLPQFRARYPEIELDLSFGVNPVRLAAREADVALRAAKVSEPNLVAVNAFRSWSGLYASREYLRRRGVPRVATGLRRHDLVRYAPEYANAWEERFMEKHAPDARVTVRANTAQLALDVIRGGGGIGILECFVADRCLDLRRVGKPLQSDVMSLVVHEDVRTAAKVRAVVAWLKECAAAAGLTMDKGPPAPR